MPGSKISAEPDGLEPDGRASWPPPDDVPPPHRITPEMVAEANRCLEDARNAVVRAREHENSVTVFRSLANEQWRKSRDLVSAAWKVLMGESSARHSSYRGGDD